MTTTRARCPGSGMVPELQVEGYRTRCPVCHRREWVLLSGVLRSHQRPVQGETDDERRMA